MNRLLAVVALALALPLGACASPTSDHADDGDQTQDVTGASALTPITLKNWTAHTKIVQVRNLVRDIDAAKASRRFTTARKGDLCPEGVGEDYRIQVTDKDGKVRMLELASGSDDSYGTRTLYFDANGKVRFVFDSTSDVHQNTYEHRVYFDADGTRIWEVTRTAHAQEIASQPFEIPQDKLELEPEEKSATAFGMAPKCN